jgi:hypothetical protein
VSKQVIVGGTQEKADVSSAEAQDAVLRGAASLTGETQTVLKDGQIMDVPTSNLARAVDLGWQLADEEEVAGVEMRREASSAGGMALGTLEAGARGASLGFSDPIITGLGGDEQMMTARREALGQASTAVEVGTSLATMGGGGLIKGGVTLGRAAAARALAKKAASNILIPGRGVARLGAATERGLASMIPEAAPQLVKSMVPLAGRGAVEGYVTNVGHSMSEAALGDRDLTAEQLLIHDGFMGAALGMGAGAALPLVGRVLAGTARVPISAAKAVANKISAANWDDGIIKTVGRLSGDAAEADILASLPRGLRARVAAGDPALVAEVAASVRDPIKRAVNDAMEAQAALLKSGRVKTRGLSVKDDGVLPRMAMDRVENAGKQIAGVARANADSDAYLTKVLKSTLKEQQAARVGIERGGSKNAYQSMATFRNKLDGEIETLGGLRMLDDAATDVRTRNTLDFLKNARDDVDNFLGDESIWRDVAKSHRGVIDATASRQAAGREISDMLKKLDADDVAYRYAIEGESMRGLDGMLDSLEKGAKHLELPDDVAAKIARARESRKAVDAAIESNRQAASGIDAMNHFAGKDRTVAKTIGSLAREGALAAGVGYGPAGWAIAKGIEAATNPVGMMRGISAVAAATEIVAKHLDVPIQRIAGAMRGSAPNVAPMAIRATANLTRAERIERVEKIRDGVAKMSDPVSAVDHLQTSLYDLDNMAPNVAQAMRGKVTAAAIFLASKAPAMYRDPFAPPSRPAMIDEASLDRYERYVTAVSDPISVVENVANGTATYEEIDALKTVYPNVYKKVADDITAKVLEASHEGHELPVAQRVSVSLMIGIPLDASLEPQMLAANQKAITMGPGPMPTAGAAPGKVRSGASSGKGAAKLAQSLALPTDRVASGGKA